MLTVFGQHKAVDGYLFRTYPLTIILNFCTTVVGLNRVSMKIEYHEGCVCLIRVEIIPILQESYLIPQAELIL